MFMAHSGLKVGARGPSQSSFFFLFSFTIIVIFVLVYSGIEIRRREKLMDSQHVWNINKHWSTRWMEWYIWFEAESPLVSIDIFGTLFSEWSWTQGLVVIQFDLG